MRSAKRVAQSISPHILGPRFLNHYKRDFSSFITKRIDKDISDKVAEIFLKEGSVDPYEYYEEVQEFATGVLDKILPESIKSELTNFYGKTSLMLIKGFDVGELPPTPKHDYKPDTNSNFLSAYYLLGILKMLGGKIYVAKDEKHGMAIHQLIPLEPEQVSGLGSKIEFNFHTENAHEKPPPDIFLLFCNRSDPAAKTTFCFLDDLERSLPESIIEELRKPQFRMKSGVSFDKHLENIDSILSINEEYGITIIKVNTAPGRCEGLNDRAKEALTVLRQATISNEKFVVLEKGDLAVIHNGRVLHGRKAFDITTSEEEKRWLLRVYSHLKQNSPTNKVDVSTISRIIDSGKNTDYDQDIKR